MPAASFQRASTNRKLSPVGKVDYHHPLWGGSKSSMFRFRPVAKGPFCSSTYASIAATCSSDCPFKMDEEGNPGGCFIDAEPFTRKAMAGLDAGALDRDSLEVIREEVALINSAFRRQPDERIPQDGARGGRDLRIHVGGDVPSAAGARLLAGAAARWLARGGGRVWTYTHTWRHIQPAAFWPISVLASCETPQQVKAARRRGYAPALVVEKFPHGKLPFVVAGTKFIPCPAETLSKTCVECRLCLDADLLGMRAGIAFQVHGDHAEQATRSLVPLKVRRAA